MLAQVASRLPDVSTRKSIGGSRVGRSRVKSAPPGLGSHTDTVILPREWFPLLPHSCVIPIRKTLRVDTGQSLSYDEPIQVEQICTQVTKESGRQIAPGPHARPPETVQLRSGPVSPSCAWTKARQRPNGRVVRPRSRMPSLISEEEQRNS